MDKGKFILDKIKGCGKSLTQVAKDLDISRSTIYQWIGDKKLSDEKLFRVADAIKIDISEDFPDFVHNSSVFYIKDDGGESKYVELKEKYINLLERHTALQEESAKYKKE